MTPRHFLTDTDLSPNEQAEVLELARRMKADPGTYGSALAGKTLGLIFTKPSTRTRAAFEVGIAQLGGQGIFLSSQASQIGRGEPITDTAQVLSRYVDLIAIRTFDHQDVRALAGASRVPVINALDDSYHPCQTLADLLTLKEACGEVSGRILAYVGDGNNVAASLMLGGVLAGVHVRVITPQGWEPDPEITARARHAAEATGGSVEVTHELDRVAGAHVVYTDVWASMGQEEERERRLAAFAGYQVSEAVMDRAGDSAVFLHCLPAHRGEEVAAAVIDGPRSRVFDQAENRLHTQKALMAFLSGTL